MRCVNECECSPTERYRSLAPMYYRGAAAAVVVYDITNKESFNGAKSWVKELQRRGDPNVVIALAGNKADLHKKRRVETEVIAIRVCGTRKDFFQEAKRYAEENGLLYMETSARNSTSVKELFQVIGTQSLLGEFVFLFTVASKLPQTPPHQERDAFPIIP